MCCICAAAGSRCTSNRRPEGADYLFNPKHPKSSFGSGLPAMLFGAIGGSRVPDVDRTPPPGLAKAGVPRSVEMRILELAAGVLASCTVVLAATAQADTASLSMRFAVMRGDTQIGTNTIELSYNGGQTLVRIATHVEI